MRYSRLSGTSKYLLIVIIILFQTSALTIGGMTAKALLTGIGPGTTGADTEGADSKNKAETAEAREAVLPTSPDMIGEKEVQARNSIIELETVIKDNTMEINKLIKKDGTRPESENTGIIQIQEQVIAGTSAK